MTQFNLLFSHRGCQALQNRVRPIAIMGAALAVVLMHVQTAGAAPLKETTANGPWENASNWTGGDGQPPVAGESIDLQNDMTVSGSTPAVNKVFGDGGENSLWSGSGTLTIEGGQQLEHQSGSTFVLTTGSPFLAGAGTFLNSGTMESQSNRFLFLSGGTTLDNAGTFEFRGTNSRVVLHDTSTPEWINNGDVVVNMDNASDIARIESEDRVGGGVFTQQGNPITFTNGILVFAPPSGIGTTLTDAEFANHFGAIGATSQLRLSGGTDIDLDSTVTDLSRVFLGDNDGTIIPKPGNTPTTIHVTGDGIRTAPGNPRVETKTAADTVTNLAGGTIVVADNGGQFWINGNGTFLNQGTMELEDNRFLVGVSGNPTLQNEGDIVFTENGARIDMWAGTPAIENLPGGKFTVNLPGATDEAQIGAEGSDLNDGFLGEFRQLGGDPIEFVQGTLIFAPPGGIGGALDDDAFADLFGPLNANSTLKLGGGISNITLTGATDLSRVRLSDDTQDLVVPVGGSIINVTAPGGIRTADGAPRIEIASGRVAENLGTLVLPSGQQFFVNGDGSLVNEGTLTIENNRFLLGVVGAPKLDNSGMIEMTENGSRINLFGAGNSEFNNLAGSLVTVNLPASGNRAEIGRENGSGGTFTNAGTIEVLRGELEIESTITTPAISGGGTSLDTGTWRVIADVDDAKLDFRAGGTGIGDSNESNFDGSIVNIGSGASLTLSAENGGTAAFPQLGTLETIDGSVFVHGSVILPVDGGIDIGGTIGGSGQFDAVGSDNSVNMLSGSTLDPGGLNGETELLVINGDLSLNSDTNVNFTLDDGEQSDRIFVTGDLDLAGKFHFDVQGGSAGDKFNLFTYGNNLTIGSIELLGAKGLELDFSTPGEVNLLLVPEPTSMLFVALPAIGLFRRRRRRRQRS